MFLGVGLVWLAACGGQPQPVVQAGAGEVAPTAEEPDRAFHMRETFWMAIDARDALVDGDLERAKEAARRLVDYDYRDAFPEDFRPWIVHMKQLADDIVLAEGLHDAAAAVGGLGVTCGNCHWQKEAGPGQVPVDPEPWRDPPEELAERMDRHQIGIERLWTGLTAPSEEAWRQGTITLTRAPIADPEHEGEPVSELTGRRVSRIRDLAQQARVASSHTERGRIYGELIATCADCHRNIRRSVP